MRCPTVTRTVLASAALLALLAPAVRGAETSAAPSASDPMVDSPWFDVGWPKFEMPKVSWKMPSFGAGDEVVSPAESGENPVSKALDRMAGASRNAADRVRGAWGSAIKKLPFGGNDSNTRVAQRDEPGFWSRLFAPEEPRGSQTVTEFLAQERVGTTR